KNDVALDAADIRLTITARPGLRVAAVVFIRGGRMRTGSRVGIFALCFGVFVVAPVAAQNEARLQSQPPLIVGPPLPPATLIEGFRAPLGSVVTVGYEVVGEVAGISVDPRELRD